MINPVLRQLTLFSEYVNTKWEATTSAVVLTVSLGDCLDSSMQQCGISG